MSAARLQGVDYASRRTRENVLKTGAGKLPLAHSKTALAVRKTRLQPYGASKQKRPKKLLIFSQPCVTCWKPRK